MKRGTTHPGADLSLSDQPFNFFLICCFRKYLNLYFLDNNLFNGRKISQLHMTDRVHVIKYPLYKFFLHFMYFNDVFVNFAIKEITCQHIIVKFELFKHEKNTVVFWCFKFCNLWNKWLYMQHHSNYMRYTSTLIIIIYQKYIVNEKNKNVKMWQLLILSN